MQVIVSSLRTTYTRLGKGKAVIILHGWGDNLKSWQALQERLAKTYDVIVVDLPGFGDTQSPPRPWGLTDYATFVGEFIDKIAVTPYALIGHSNGGAIALRGLASHTLTADRLVLLASAGIRNQYKGRQKILRLITKTGKIATLLLPKQAKRYLRRKVYQTVGSDMLVAEHLQATFKKVVEDDVQADAATITQPTLLVYGDQDAEAPLWYGQQFHELMTNSTLEILPGVGHWLHRDRPDQILTNITEFLA